MELAQWHGGLTSRPPPDRRRALPALEAPPLDSDVEGVPARRRECRAPPRQGAGQKGRRTEGNRFDDRTH
jgi:hypothetical protein